MSDRPNPDALLRDLQRDTQRGRLKVFLGASAGVGKTYAMLSEAREQQERGVDVLLGFVETHGRRETEAQIQGLERLPLREFEYRSVQVKEFDLDAALVRHPELCLVDELAHSNAPGSRHAKRWQDVVELLDAGIDVYTAVNVQHLESLNDPVAQITGVIVRETVPDAFLERADEIEVVDVPPDELRQRLKEGKVYVPERIEHALEGFFKTGNLIALRELALRRAADRVDAQMQRYRAEQGIRGLWPTRERILVCIAPNRLASRVVRAAARLGAASHGELVAVYVESDRQSRRPAEEHERAREALRLAESLGMETVTLSGHDIVEEVLSYARRRNANLVVVGKPIKPRWRELLFGSVVDEMVRRSGEIDIHVITGEGSPESPARPIRTPGWGTVPGHAWSLVVVGLASAVCAVLYGRVAPANLVMVYLLGVTFVASRFGSWEAASAALLSVVVFDVAFVPPKGTLAVSDTQYLITFGAMLLVALVISRLTLRLREQVRATAERERRTASLYALSRELARSRGQAEIAAAAAREIASVFETETVVFVLRNGRIDSLAASTSGFERVASEMAVAQWALEHDEVAGKGTDTLPGAKGMYLPLRGAGGAVGVVAFLPNDRVWPLPPAQRNLLETFANGLGLALERAQLAKESHEARIAAESERLRNALLSSISHDLRTPLTSIAGAASALLREGGDPKELAETIYHESLRLNLQVQNLLDMTRLHSGEVTAKLEWNSLEEIVGTALARTRDFLGARPLTLSVPADLPLLKLDAGLIEKLLTNLLENAGSHTPPGTPIEISAEALSESIRLLVADRGPGIAAGQEAAIFERFAQAGPKGQGLGLGLAICRAIARLHDARVWARNRPGGGAEFLVEFPRPLDQPTVPVG
jgi:two-component system sensor histidine kinase KdpD